MKLGRTADAAAAVVALQKSLELDGEVPETHYALASLFAQSNETGRAEAAYREAIRLQPDYSAAHMNLAILLFQGNRAGEARPLRGGDPGSSRIRIGPLQFRPHADRPEPSGGSQVADGTGGAVRLVSGLEDARSRAAAAFRTPWQAVTRFRARWRNL